MIKIYTMIVENDKYIIRDDIGTTFEIPKNTLSVDGKKLYDALFLNFEKGDSIKINKDSSFKENDKLSNAVYTNMVEIIEKIVVGINNFTEEIDENE